jgi:hypothetical protein
MKGHKINEKKKRFNTRANLIIAFCLLIFFNFLINLLKVKVDMNVQVLFNLTIIVFIGLSWISI